MLQLHQGKNMSACSELEMALVVMCMSLPHYLLVEENLADLSCKGI